MRKGDICLGTIHPAHLQVAPTAHLWAHAKQNGSCYILVMCDGDVAALSAAAWERHRQRQWHRCVSAAQHDTMVCHMDALLDTPCTAQPRRGAMTMPPSGLKPRAKLQVHPMFFGGITLALPSGIDPVETLRWGGST